jgi:hypothetical protein
MYTATQLQEYLDEIRDQVCTRCVERPPEGPPCKPLRRMCGIELHLREYLKAIHTRKSGSIVPYLDDIHQQICSGCAFRAGERCPCPLDYLVVLLVQAVDTVDQRNGKQGCSGLPSRCSHCEELLSL